MATATGSGHSKPGTLGDVGLETHETYDQDDALVGAIDLPEAHQPSPGQSQGRADAAATFTRWELAAVIAVVMLTREDEAPASLGGLLAETRALVHHKGLQAEEVVAGRQYLDLDRDNDRILMSMDNLMRCAHFLHNHPFASECTASCFLGMEPHTNLIDWVSVRLNLSAVRVASVLMDG